MEQLKLDVTNFESLALLKKRILAFVRLSTHSTFHFHNPNGSRLSLSLSHLQCHTFKHSFQDTLNLPCNCGTDELFTTLFIVPIFQMKD